MDLETTKKNITKTSILQLKILLSTTLTLNVIIILYGGTKMIKPLLTIISRKNVNTKLNVQ